LVAHLPVTGCFGQRRPFILLLIIDESHHTAGADNTRSLINLINAKVTIEVSATPKISGDETVTVYREHVIGEEMIKKQIAINSDAENIIKGTTIEGFQIETSDKDTTNELLVKMALAKREQLKKYYEQANSDVNPLLLIQLPDKRADVDLKDEIVSILEDNHQITVNNGKLAIYLSEDKENLDTITKNNSPVEVMIFKQAIALGWDCPRASILALFRDWRSIVFSIQTVGRIMRWYNDQEVYHYDENRLSESGWKIL
jgi:type III restriction enzyme